MTPKRTKIVLISSIVVGIMFGILMALCCDNECVIRFKKLSENLISDFLTIASFLFAFETFIIFKVKEGIYDSEEYRLEYGSNIKENGLYTNLKRFSDFLLKSTAFAFITSIVLLIYIVTDLKWLLPVCLACIVGSIASLVMSWILMRKNLNVYLGLI